MLSKRQNLILIHMFDNGQTYCSSNELSKQFNISVRTVKSEIEIIKNYLRAYPSVELISVPSKGYHLTINNVEQAEKDFLEFKKQLDSFDNFNEQSIRVKYIIHVLLDSSGYVRKGKLLDHLCISESTLYLDLKETKKIIEKYDLTIQYKSGSGYCVLGSEKNKRACITKEDTVSHINHDNIYDSIDIKEIKKLKEYLIELFLKYKYKISEELLESLIVHLMLTKRRISKGFIIEKNDDLGIVEDIEHAIANDILNHIAPKLEKNRDYELVFLSNNLKGKRDYTNYHEVSDDINVFINQSINKIKKEYGVDFSSDIDLKVVLTLHFVPLLSRMKNNAQLNNVMLNEIKKTFPFAFDISQYFGTLISEKYNLDINEDEAAYLTLYFDYGLENVNLNTNGKKILVVSSYKNSETFLLKQRIMQWFNKQISELTFVSPHDLNNIELSKYDALFTTEKDDEVTKGAAVHIDLFPKEKDFSKMNFAINGYNNIETIANKFSKDLFYVGDAKSKEDIVNRLIKMSTDKFDLPNKFKQLVLERERLSNTYFAKYIAIPHPLYPICNQTFISVAILNNAIEWDEDKEVNIVMLVSTELNNPKAFQIWTYLSPFVCNEEKVKEVLAEPTFENFIEKLKESLADKF